jgi:hypothetical protein
LQPDRQRSPAPDRAALGQRVFCISRHRCSSPRRYEKHGPSGLRPRVPDLDRARGELVALRNLHRPRRSRRAESRSSSPMPSRRHQFIPTSASLIARTIYLALAAHSCRT